MNELNVNSVLLAQRKGQLIIEAQEALQNVVKAVVKTGRKGRLTITLDIEPGADETVILHDDVTGKIPKPVKKGSTFFPLENGSLTREDPRQGEFEVVKDIAENQ